jgi:alpha-L-rhamnosidase
LGIRFNNLIKFILIIFCSSCTSSNSLTVHKPPTILKVEDRTNPIGIGDTTPEFSWITEDYEEGKAQSAYQVIVASSPDILDEGKADMWNSGKIRSDNSALISYSGKALQSRGLYYWKVRTWNNEGNASFWSEPAHFEIGLLTNEDWNVKWIWREIKNTGSDYCYFRKSFDLINKPVVRARIYLSVCHRHEFYVNGELVGKGPNFAYPDEQYYQTFDIGPFLKSGQQNVFALLGVHWGKGGQGRPLGSQGLLFKAIIEFDDGTSIVIGSDKTWKIHKTEWIETDLYRNGENIPYDRIDGRLYPTGWNQLHYDDSKWNVAVEIGTHPVSPWVNPLIAQETIITEYEISPVQVIKIGKGHFVADFGKVYPGMPMIQFSGGKPGTLIRIKADYRTKQDGTLAGYSQNTKMDYEYTLRGGSETFRPFWYLGFRYIEVENAPESFGGQSIRMIVRHNKVDAEQSSFECSNTTVNGVWELGKRSAMLTCFEQFVDTPTREQGQFTYDSYLISGAVMKCFMERDLTQQGIKQFAQSQLRYHKETGKINAAYPNGDGKRDIKDWTQAFILWVWEYYMQTGDHELIGEIFEELINTGMYNKNAENKLSGLIDWGSVPINHDAAKRYATGIVDWVDHYSYDLSTSQRAVLSINAYLNYLYLAKMADVLGKKKIHDQFQQYANNILYSIRQQLWDGGQKAYIDGLFEDGTKSKHASQQTNAMMLALSLTDKGQENGVMDIVKREGQNTGVLLIRFLIQAYGECDEDESLFEFLTNAKGNNYAYSLADGGTFAYENWRLSTPTSESHGYGSYGAICAIQDYILGVKPILPQYAHVQIKPHLTGKLKFARGKVPTQRGQIFVDWQNDQGEGRFTLKIKIPFNVVADVYVPRNQSNGTMVYVNGIKRTGKLTGKYIMLKKITAGEYVFVR